MANMMRDLAELKDRVNSLHIVSQDRLAHIVARVSDDAARAVEAAEQTRKQHTALVQQFCRTLGDTRQTVRELEDRIGLLDGGVSIWRILISKWRGWLGVFRRSRRRPLPT